MKPKTLELDGWTPCGALAGHAVLKDSFAQLAFVPLDAPPGEQKARVISPLPVEPRTLLEAQVIDNPHNLLRLRTASHPLLELRTGPLGLGPDSIVRVGSTGLWEDRGQPLIDVLDIEEGGIVSRRLRADDTFVKVPPSLSLGTVTPYEPPPVPTVAVIPTPVRVALATLRSIGLIADTAPPPAEIESHFGRPDRPFSPVFLDEALSLFGPGPDVHLLHYDWDEFHLIPREVQEIVPNLAFEDSFDDGKDWLADDYFFKSPTGRGVHLDPDDLPIELISALNEALAHAGADRVVIPLLSETRALTIAVAPPRMLEAIEEHNLPGLLREA